MVFATIAALRTYLNQIPESVATDAVLQEIIERSSSLVAQALYPVTFQTEMPVASSIRVRTFGSARYLEVPRYWPDTITSIKQDGITISSFVIATEKPFPEYSVSPYLWPAGVYEITASWGNGYAPDLVTQITLEVAVNIWRTRSTGSFSDTTGGGSAGDPRGGGIRYVGGMLPQHKDAISALKRQYLNCGVR